MKRIAWILILALLFAVPACCCAEDSAVYCWHELNEDVLTVRLPASADGEWQFSISEPKLLELITCEFVEADGEFVASFRNFSEKAGEVVLQLYNKASGTHCGVLVNALKGGGIEVDGTYMASAGILTVRMKADTSAGGKWSTQFSGCPSMLVSEGSSEVTGEDTSATYTAAYMLMGNPAGAVLRVGYTDDEKISVEKQYKVKF